MESRKNELNMERPRGWLSGTKTKSLQDLSEPGCAQLGMMKESAVR